ncbi:MAG: Tat pathway signal protein [Burkholderiales bacterium]|nr:Tat pathway signal protein [Burkholderiales bacterium]
MQNPAPVIGSPNDPRARLRELARCATLAPSSHNTQCWRFRIDADAVTILPDWSRRCPVVDPDDHHLLVSLGCAAENLIQAARAHGLEGTLLVDATHDPRLRIALQPAAPAVTPMFRAIVDRQCTRTEYDGRSVPASDLALLEQAGTGNGVHVRLITDRPAMDSILDYVVQGNTAQLTDPAFVDELRHWIRFSTAEAKRHGDGLAAAVTGNPSIPRWLGAPLLRRLLTPRHENDRCARQIRSSAGIAIFVSERDDAAHRVEAGRCYERFALQATALGIRNAFVNQPVEVPSLRRQFMAHLGIGSGRPDLVVRFGHGPLMPRSYRRPLDAVLEAASPAPGP